MAISGSAVHLGSNLNIPMSAAALILMVFVLEASASSSAKSLLATTRSLSEANPSSPLVIDMMHIDHVDAPYSQSGLSLQERAANAMTSSKNRLNYFLSKINEITQARLGKKLLQVYESPLAADPGIYIMQIGVGTPAREFFAVADTGSDLVWLQCTPCDPCFNETDLPFDPTQSSSYNDTISCDSIICSDLSSFELPCSLSNLCQYNYSYGDQSFTSGSLVSETFSFETIHGSVFELTSSVFGCGFGNQVTFNRADGLVGLGLGPLSLIQQLGPSINYTFSYCLVSRLDAINRTSSLLLGSQGNQSLIYTPLVENDFFPSWYYISLLDISVGGTTVNIPAGTFDIDLSGNGGLIVDSGTTITQLTDAAYTPFLSAVAALVTYPTIDLSADGYDLCYSVGRTTTPVFPSVVFTFAGVNLILADYNVFILVDNDGTYCFAFANAGVDAAVNVFGNVQQQNFLIAFDLLDSRLGFAGVTC